MNFPGVFWGKFFREFSEFRKFPRNFPEIFLHFPEFYISKKIDFRAGKLRLHEKSPGIFGKISGEFLEIPEFLKTCQYKLQEVFYKS